jgi:hypothetical protein
MGQNRVEMKMRRVETGWFYAAPAVLNSLISYQFFFFGVYTDCGKTL